MNETENAQAESRPNGGAQGSISATEGAERSPSQRENAVLKRIAVCDEQTQVIERKIKSLETEAALVREKRVQHVEELNGITQSRNVRERRKASRSAQLQPQN